MRHTLACRGAVVAAALLCWATATGGGLRMPGSACLQLAAARHSSRQGARGAVALRAEPERIVRLSAERVVDSMVPGGTAAQLDKLMESSFLEIFAVGAEKVEPVLERPGLYYAYMPVSEIGPYKGQLRLVCSVATKSGRIDVDVVEFSVGELRGGKMEFVDYTSEEFTLTWRNSITWRDRRAGMPLRMIHTSSGRARMVLPDWFPVPDPLIKAAADAFIDRLLTDGQANIVGAIRKQFS